MDSLELNKIIAGVLGAVLTLMLFTWVGDIVYGMYGSHDGDHLAYEIELPETGDVEMAEVDAGPAIGELLMTASAESGEGLFRACAACHNAAVAENKVGPYLINVMGRPIAAATEYEFSDALLSKSDMVWDAENFSAFIENPRGWAPGTKMGYNGMRRAEDRADIIAYLVSVSGQDINEFIVAAEAAAAEELPTGAEGGVVAAELEVAPETAATPADVIVTEEPVETAPTAAPEATDANVVAPEAAEPVAEESTAPAAEPAIEEEAAPAEAAPAAVAPVEEAPAEAAPVEEAPVEAAPAEEAAAPAAVIPAFMANADAAAGESAFRACRACHVVDAGVNRTGPSLYAIVGRDIGAADGYNYSSAMAEHGGEWSYENLNAFLEAPRTWLPGTKMGYAGMRSEQDRANVIAYLESVAQ